MSSKDIESDAINLNPCVEQHFLRLGLGYEVIEFIGSWKLATLLFREYLNTIDTDIKDSAGPGDKFNIGCVSFFEEFSQTGSSRKIISLSAIGNCYFHKRAPYINRKSQQQLHNNKEKNLLIVIFLEALSCEFMSPSPDGDTPTAQSR